MSSNDISEVSVPGFSPGNMGGMTVRNPYMPAVPVTPGVHMPQDLQFSAPPSLGKTEYLFEEGEKQKRGIFGRMIGFGGFGFLGGMVVVGGAQGTIEGLRGMNPNDPWRIKGATLMNALTKRGPEWGNRLGVVGLTAGLVHAGVSEVRGGKTDALNTIVAGAVAPAVFQKSVARAVLSSGVGASLAGAYLVATAMFEGQSNPVVAVFDSVSDAISTLTDK
eukprot:m.58785 g.58785  ORF g.58785 m.58785 type:complete len:220 (-) comp22612_c0_seq1:490-1149(-)